MYCYTFSLDLHVLGTPPALILSQDQTLNLIRSLIVHTYDRTLIKLTFAYAFSFQRAWLFGLKLVVKIGVKKTASICLAAIFFCQPPATFTSPGTSDNYRRRASECQRISESCCGDGKGFRGGIRIAEFGIRVSEW